MLLVTLAMTVYLGLLDGRLQRPLQGPVRSVPEHLGLCVPRPETGAGGAVAMSEAKTKTAAKVDAAKSTRKSPAKKPAVVLDVPDGLDDDDAVGVIEVPAVVIPPTPSGTWCTPTRATRTRSSSTSSTASSRWACWIRSSTWWYRWRRKWTSRTASAAIVERKIFPGYVLVRMLLNDDTWSVVRNTRA